MEFYSRTDKLLDAFDLLLIDRFDELKAALKTTSGAALEKRIRQVYDELYDYGFECFLRLAECVYVDHKGKKKPPDEDWLQEILDNPDPVSKYTFTHELDRRAARLFEAVSVGGIPNPYEEVDMAKRSMALAYHIYAVRVTDDAAVKAMKDSGVKKVRWVAEDDTHTCKVCHGRDDKVYPTDDIPPKPHINCRCWLVRVP